MPVIKTLVPKPAVLIPDVGASTTLASARPVDSATVAFLSVATNLVSNDTNGLGDIFVAPVP